MGNGDFFKKNWYKLAGIALFIYILYRTDFNGVFSILKQISILKVLAAISLFYLLVLIKSFKLKLLVDDFPITLKKMYILNMRGMYFGLVTPGRVGELVRIKFLIEAGVSRFKSFLIVIGDRVFDVLIVVISSLFYLIFVEPDIIKQIPEIYVKKSTIIILIAAVAFFSLIAIVLLKKKLHIIKEYLPALKSIKFYTINISLSFIYILAYALQMYFLSLSLNIPLSFFTLYFCITLMMFASMLPITFMGLGTRDAIFIFIFSFYGISQTSAISYSLCILFFYLINIFLSFMFTWIKD